MDGDDDGADDQEYSWEGIYQRPWESVHEAADGSLYSAAAGRRRHGAQHVALGVKRGVLRSVFVVIDASKHASEQDAEMRPSRLAVMVDAASAFVREFFEQNPISTLAVLATRDGRAELLTDPSCNPRPHLQALARLGADVGRGEASLQNVFELARESLHAVPSFTSREVILLSSSLSTCDPGDILYTIAALRRDKLRAYIYSLLAEVFICRKIAADTGGEYGVPVSASHLRELMLHLVPPRPSEAGAGAGPAPSLIRVGFPRRREKLGGGGSSLTLGFSVGSGGAVPSLCDAPYRCPQCEACHVELPTQCPICGLKLMSSVELTKTYHHLFPVPVFTELIHSMLHTCPGCELATSTAAKSSSGGSHHEEGADATGKRKAEGEAA